MKKDSAPITTNQLFARQTEGKRELGTAKHDEFEKRKKRREDKKQVVEKGKVGTGGEAYHLTKDENEDFA